MSALRARTGKRYVSNNSEALVAGIGGQRLRRESQIQSIIGVLWNLRRVGWRDLPLLHHGGGAAERSRNAAKPQTRGGVVSDKKDT